MEPALSHRYGDARSSAGLGSMPVATKKKTAPAAEPQTIGQRLIAALVPAHFPTLAALHHAIGGSYSTLSNWKNGSKSPDLASLEAVARLVGKEPLDLLYARSGDTTALRNHPRFAAALAAAKVRFRGRIPDGAYERAADTQAAQWPEQIDDVFVYDLAQFWWKNAPDSEVSMVEEAEMRAEMAAIDAKRM